MDDEFGKLPKFTVPYVAQPVVERFDEPVIVIDPAITSPHADALLLTSTLPLNVTFPFG